VNQQNVWRKADRANPPQLLSTGVLDGIALSVLHRALLRLRAASLLCVRYVGKGDENGEGNPQLEHGMTSSICHLAVTEGNGGGAGGDERHQEQGEPGRRGRTGVSHLSVRKWPHRPHFPRQLWLRRLVLLCCSCISALFRNVAAVGDALRFDRRVSIGSHERSTSYHWYLICWLMGRIFAGFAKELGNVLTKSRLIRSGRLCSSLNQYCSIWS
jgi:hypothetical protein